MIESHVESALKSTGVQAAVLDMDQRIALLARINELVGVNVERSMAWDSVRSSGAVRRVDGWELIPSFVGDESSCLMFLDEARTIWRFLRGTDLLEVLGECPPFEFYVCDEKAEYLICFNHHDYLIGWGRAQSWVASLASPSDPAEPDRAGVSEGR